MNLIDRDRLHTLARSHLHALETEQGILASGKDELYGCIFGRDSLITSLVLLDSPDAKRDDPLRALVKKILLNLASLQGRETNAESGEEPGKMIHEFRREGHAHLTAREKDPWHVYPDGVMRNYDTVDATPLFLMATLAYLRATPDRGFEDAIMPHVYAALRWLTECGDSNRDGFIDYRIPEGRTGGGLSTQSWMDSHDSIFLDDGSAPRYPIAPAEAQSYAYAAMHGWSAYLGERGDRKRSLSLARRARLLKRRFNRQFLILDESAVSLAFALDGDGRPMKAARSSMGHALWAASRRKDGTFVSIIDDDLVPLIVARLMMPDLFVPSAGIRTLSSSSSRFSPQSYHNGSIWPHDTAIVAEGMAQFGFAEEARMVRESLLETYLHFGTPIELFAYDGAVSEYVSPAGQRACRSQAWSAAALYAMTARA